jgi:hypothetical protein
MIDVARPRDRGDKPITAARQGLNETRILGAIAKRFPQLTNGAADGVIEIDVGVFRPEFSPNLFAIHNISSTMEQQGKNLKWLLLDSDPDTMLAQLA